MRNEGGDIRKENMSLNEVRAYLLANVRIGVVEELFNIRSQITSQFSASNVSNRSKSQTDDVLVDMMQVTMQIAKRKDVLVDCEGRKMKNEESRIFKPIFQP